MSPEQHRFFKQGEEVLVRSSAPRVLRRRYPGVLTIIETGDTKDMLGVASQHVKLTDKRKKPVSVGHTTIFPSDHFYLAEKK